MADPKICCMKGCHKIKVTLKNSKYFCDSHIDALKCKHCLCFSSSAFQRGKCNGEILCNKCFDKHKFVDFEYPVCYYKTIEACTSEQEENSIFCERHKNIKICVHCDRYRTDNNVVKYRELGGELYCGLCIEKIENANLVEHKEDSRIAKKVRQICQNRRKNILNSRKYKKRKADQDNSDSDESGSSESEGDNLGSEIDSEAEREAQENDDNSDYARSDSESESD